MADRAEHSSQALELYRRALASRRQGEWRQALELLQSSCRLNRQLGWNWLELAELLRERGALIEAMVAYEAALAAQPADAAVLHRRSEERLATLVAGERLTRGLGPHSYRYWLERHEPALPDPQTPLQQTWHRWTMGAQEPGLGLGELWSGKGGKQGWLVLLAPGTVLRPGALAAVEVALDQRSDPWLPDLISADEDRLDAAGRRADPWFKPDYTPESFWSTPWLASLSIWRLDWLRARGLPPPPAAPEHGLAWQLQALAAAPRCLHLGSILVHQGHPGGLSPQRLAEQAGERIPEPHEARAVTEALALQTHLQQAGEAVAAVVPHGERGQGFRLSWAIPRPCLCSLIIPSRDRPDLLGPCLESLQATAGAALAGRSPAGLELELILIDNGSREQATAELLRQWQERLGGRLRIRRDDGPFNWSRLNNTAAREARGELLLLLNNDTEATAAGWLEAMAAQALRPAIGAVGAVLTYPAGTIQHAGIAVGVRDAIFHPYRRLGLDHAVHRGRTSYLTTWGAVTGACLMVERDLLARVGWLEEALPVEFNDVELGLRLAQLGYRNVVVPEAVLVHRESQSRDAYRSATEAPARALMLSRWGPRLRQRQPWWPRQASGFWEDGRPVAMPGEPGWRPRAGR